MEAGGLKPPVSCCFGAHYISGNSTKSGCRAFTFATEWPVSECRNGAGVPSFEQNSHTGATSTRSGYGKALLGML
jgi:hypothetical protein